jgi:hypothetical protein
MTASEHVAVSPGAWRTLARLDRWRLAASVWGPALVVRVLKHLMPLPRLVRLARATARRPLAGPQAAALLAELQPSRMSTVRLPGNCLDRSLAVFRLLSPSEPTLRLIVGARRGGETIDGHVWLTLRGAPLWDDPVWLAAFHPVVSFGPDGPPSGPSG